MKSPELADLSGISYRQLDWWVRNRYLRPVEGCEVTMPGWSRHFDYIEVEIAVRMGVLTRADIAVKMAARIARQMVEQRKDTCHITLDGHRRVTITYLPEPAAVEEAS